MFLHQVFLQPNWWKNLLYFWISPLSEGKQLIHALLCFPTRFCWPPAIPPEPLWEHLTLHSVLWPMQLAESSGYHFSQKTCVERRKRLLHSRLIYWSWTLDLYLQPSLSTLPKLGLWEECLFPLLCMCSGLCLKPHSFHEVISWHLAKYF